MAGLSGDVKLPGVGNVPKAGVVGGAVLGGVLLIVYLRGKKSSSSAAAATPAASTGPYPWDGTVGNPADLYSEDPATGQTYGNEQAGASQGGGSFAAPGTLSNAYPWDGTSGNTSDPFSMDPSTGQTYGNEGYGGTGASSGYSYGNGPPFTSNAAWAQYAENYLTSTVGLDGPTVGAALGLYQEGSPVTSAQQSIIDQAIAFAGNPPVSGPGGYPPQIRVTSNTGGGTGPQAKIPNVVDMDYKKAGATLTAAGFTFQYASTPTPDEDVKSQSPAANTAASQGTLVTLTLGPGEGGVRKPKPKPKPPPHKKG